MRRCGHQDEPKQLQHGLGEAVLALYVQVEDESVIKSVVPRHHHAQLWHVQLGGIGGPGVEKLLQLGTTDVKGAQEGLLPIGRTA